MLANHTTLVRFLIEERRHHPPMPAANSTR